MPSINQITERMRNVIFGIIGLLYLSTNLRGQTSCDADLNHDSVVNLQDLLAILVHYGDSCHPFLESYPSILISEIHYNPSTVQGSDNDWEFLEVYNPNTFGVALSGWRLEDGISYNFDESDSIHALSFLVLARDSDTLSTVVPEEIPMVEWPGPSGLNNTGETLTLLSPNGSVITEVAYEDNDGWMTSPDGDGPSLELMDYNLPNGEVASWAASFVIGGTPGAANSMWGLSETE